MKKIVAEFMKKIQIKIMMRYYLPPMRKVCIKNIEDNHCWL